MNSNRPYIIRALYDWICDHQLTPHLLVDASFSENMTIPDGFIKDDRIVLNISLNAVRDLDLGNDYINFKGRFSGQSMHVYFPTGSVLAIYAKENGHGMSFPEEEGLASNEVALSNPEEDKKKKRAHLKLVE